VTAAMSEASCLRDLGNRATHRDGWPTVVVPLKSHGAGRERLVSSQARELALGSSSFRGPSLCTSELASVMQSLPHDSHNQQRTSSNRSASATTAPAGRLRVHSVGHV